MLDNNEKNLYFSASLYTAGQSEKQPSIKRIKTKSALLGVNVHSVDASSISNLQFDGTKVGWTGDKSVPMISADSYWSAMSL
jgi:hypothetical protein